MELIVKTAYLFVKNGYLFVKNGDLFVTSRQPILECGSKFRRQAFMAAGQATALAVDNLESEKIGGAEEHRCSVAKAT